jgi:hypothetical protein
MENGNGEEVLWPTPGRGSEVSMNSKLDAE